MPAETKKNPMLVPFLTVMLMLASVAGSLLVTASKSADGTYAYSHNSSVMLSELCKLLLSAGILLWQLLMKGPTGGPKITVSMQGFKYAVPALLYAVHNNLIFVALLVIEPVTFELFNNLKIITAAVLFRVVLQRELRVSQWMGVLLLLAAMAIFSDAASQADPVQAGIAGGEKIVTGFMYMVCLAFLSSFAGIYNEVLIKDSEDSLYWQNLQLYAFSTAFCMVKHVMAPDEQDTKTFFEGFDTALPWCVVLLNGFCGTLISLVFKYADNMVKCYATGTALWGSAICSHYLFGKELRPSFMFSGVVVTVSLFLYFATPETLANSDTECVAACGVTPWTRAGTRRIATRGILLIAMIAAVARAIGLI